mmetsp:Transcript_3347/g.9521  ORF Transcript_3347/g.9521 Transcript_3347/m.9521 type:complete len:495 (+) Transcript_3347:74-1558(+)
MVDDSSFDDIIRKIQIAVLPRRIRVREFFVDYDPLKSGRVTQAQFARALNQMGLSLGRQQIETLAAHLVAPSATMSARAQEINYDAFCQAVDHPGASPPMPVAPAPRTGGLDEEEKMTALLQKVAMLSTTRGVVLKYCFTDFDRSPTASPSRISARAAGKVTKNQFNRLFPFTKDIGEENVAILADRYMSDNGDIDYMQLHNEVVSIMPNGMGMSSTIPPYPRSDLVLKPDDARWSHEHLNPVDKLRSRVVEKRVRLYEHFQDFDPLRKGFCTVGQVKTVFTIMNIGKELDRGEIDYLFAEYTREDGMFNYAQFCGEVNKDFTNVDLERDPQIFVTMPDASTTAPARRNRMSMTPRRVHRVYELEEKIRARIRNRRILLNPAFQDMDRTSQGHVTRSQFARVMSMLGFELDEAGVALLAGVYCDLGNHNSFNYKDFVRSVDPGLYGDPQTHRSLDDYTAMAPQSPRYADCTPRSKYFDSRGEVRAANRLAGAVF